MLSEITPASAPPPIGKRREERRVKKESVESVESVEPVESVETRKTAESVDCRKRKSATHSSVKTGARHHASAETEC